jgi:endonuclease/exonuclease/phosphatase family metal-dependent hydrolase
LLVETKKSSKPETNTQLKIATFNLFNYLEPPNAYYDFDRIYSTEQWLKKQNWISAYLQEYQPDIIGFQEVFSPDSLRALVAAQGYEYFAVVDEPEIIDDFIYRSPVVAIASRFPIVEISAINPNIELAQALGLTHEFSFSRKVVRATVDVPHIGNCDCYVVHFKSKRSMLNIDEEENNWSPEKTIIESLKASIAGSWGATIQRGSEATLLMIEMITRREATEHPMILMGDFNNTLTDGVLTHLLTSDLRFVSSIDKDTYLAKYCLNDAWSLFETFNENNKPDESSEKKLTDTPLIANKTADANQVTTPRSPTHYYGASNSVLDYILLSCEFDASYHNSIYEVSDYHTYDRHLINPIFDRDGESTDHGIVLITLTLRT